MTPTEAQAGMGGLGSRWRRWRAAAARAVPLNRADAAVVLGLIAYAVGLGYRYRDWNFDDAMIVYRVVRNLVAGEGWYFNVGEPVNASTSVLNTVLVAILARVVGSIPTAAHVVGTVGVAGAGVLLYVILRGRSGMVLAAVGSGLLVHEMAVDMVWGLEYHAFYLLLLLFVVLRQRPMAPWVTMGALILTRPDALLLPAFKLANDVLRRRSPVPWRGMILLGLILLPWALYSLLTFGQVLPDTLGAKMWQGRSGFWGEGWIYANALATRFVEAGPVGWGITAAAMVGWWADFRDRGGLSWIAAFVVVQQMVYVGLNVPRYHWYFTTLEWTLVVLAFAAPSVLNGRLNIPDRRRMPVALILLAAALGLAWLESHKHDVERRDEMYAAAVRRVEAKGVPPGTLATLEVGTMAFTTDRQIVDLTGLTTVNPEYLTKTHLDTFFAAPPRVIILHDPPWHHELSLSYDVRLDLLYEGPNAIEGLPLTYYLLREGVQVTEDLDTLIRTRLPAFDPVLAQTLEGSQPVGDGHAAHLDRINGTAVGRRPTHKVTSEIQIQGWSVEQHAHACPEVFVVLVPQEGGPARAVRAERGRRPDVATHFGDPKLVCAGFLARASTYRLQPGRYRVRVVQGRPGSWRHRNFDPVIVVE